MSARCSARTKFFATRQPALHHDRARQVDDADDEERVSPVEMVRDHPGDVPPTESAQHGSRNVRRHGAADVAAAETLR